MQRWVGSTFSLARGYLRYSDASRSLRRRVERCEKSRSWSRPLAPAALAVSVFSARLCPSLTSPITLRLRLFLPLLFFLLSLFFTLSRPRCPFPFALSVSSLFPAPQLSVSTSVR
eukprot:6213652-Pleurochrysis_carterae.AAC.1